MKAYSKSFPIPGFIRDGGKIMIPYNISEYTESEEEAGYQFDYFEIEDTGQNIMDANVLSKIKQDIDKYTGIEILGVKCSATAEDQWGLGSIRAYIIAGNKTPFYFSNGNTLVLTPENIGVFEAAWVPFRQSFFKITEV